MVEDEDLRKDIQDYGVRSYKPRPIIIADPSQRTKDLLVAIYGRFIPKFYNNPKHNFLDRTYVLDESGFAMARQNPLFATARLSPRGEQAFVDIIEIYNKTEQDTSSINTLTLRQVITQEIGI